MFDFYEWMDATKKSPIVYHVSYLRNVEDIFRSMLTAAGGSSAWLKPHLQYHSRQGVFFCSTPKCVMYWLDNLIEQAFNMSDNPVEEEWIPVILRMKLNRNAWIPDKYGNAETQNNYFTKKNINPAGIELWNGYKWSNDPEDVMNLKYYFESFYNNEFTNFHFDNYPLPKRW